MNEVRDYLEHATAALEFLKGQYGVSGDDSRMRGIVDDAVLALLHRKPVPRPEDYLRKTVRNLFFRRLQTH